MDEVAMATVYVTNLFVRNFFTLDTRFEPSQNFVLKFVNYEEYNKLSSCQLAPEPSSKQLR